jgi:hypothetical protein
VEATHPSRPRKALGVPIALSQHPHQHRPKGPVLLAVDQELGEGAALRVASVLADPVGSFEVREHQDVEQLGAGSGTEGGVYALTQLALEVLQVHGIGR